MDAVEDTHNSPVNVCNMDNITRAAAYELFLKMLVERVNREVATKPRQKQVQ